LNHGILNALQPIESSLGSACVYFGCAEYEPCQDDDDSQGKYGDNSKESGAMRMAQAVV
jgi:hypothetical protein